MGGFADFFFVAFFRAAGGNMYYVVLALSPRAGIKAAVRKKFAMLLYLPELL
jgi:hypothetical protein